MSQNNPHYFIRPLLAVSVQRPRSEGALDTQLSPWESRLEKLTPPDVLSLFHKQSSIFKLQGCQAGTCHHH